MNSVSNEIEQRQPDLNHSEKGMTLIELMIAMAISSFLMASVFNVYQNIYSSGVINDELSVLQQNGRFAIDMMTKDLRMAGYTGCSSEELVFKNFVAGGHVASFEKQLNEDGSGIDNSVQGWEAAGTNYGEAVDVYVSGAANVLSSTLSDGDGNLGVVFNVSANSDVIGMWGARGREVGVLAADIPTATFSVDQDGMEVGDFIVVSDCTSQASILEVCGVAGNLVTTDGACGNDLTKGLNNILGGGTAMRVQGAFYYISRVDGRDLPSLFRRTLDAEGNFTVAQELVEGVENMQILYGLNTDEDGVEVDNKQYGADVYAPASAIAAQDWKNVVSVQVSLLVASVDDGSAPVADNYRYNGYAEALVPDDRRVRRVFTKTIALRNRVL
jgi:type IV pilus assembly protein PilW